MKKQNKSAMQNQYRVVHTRGQKIKGWLALVMLFVCGVMVGACINEQKNQKISKEFVPNQIMVYVNPNNVVFGDVAYGDSVVRELNVSANMPVKIVSIEKSLDYPHVSVDSDCMSLPYVDEKHSCKIFVTLKPIEGEDFVMNSYYGGTKRDGAPDDMLLVVNMVDMNGDVMDADIVLKHGRFKEKILDNEKPCKQIEASLNNRAQFTYGVDRARIYAQISERGCPENAKKYANLAKQELDIARGVSDDKFNEEETVDIIEIYKRLDMQSAAQEVFDMAKKLTNPTIDFILQVEKILNQN